MITEESTSNQSAVARPGVGQESIWNCCPVCWNAGLREKSGNLWEKKRNVAPIFTASKREACPRPWRKSRGPRKNEHLGALR